MQRTVAQIPWRSNLALAGYTNPKNLKSSLPTIEEIEAEFSEEENDE